jgi:site-specific DNA-methyltransferase (adenine-specific)
MNDGYEIKQGDCLQALKTLESESIDACVTDPPYELGFMGKAWDSTGIAYNVNLWREIYRVLKPGAYLLAFGGSRTYHRMACAIEDAGFEIRDQIQWIYGSGFPKSLDVSKAIDKASGVVREDKFEGLGRNIGPTGNKKCEACGKWLVSGTPCQCPRPQDLPQSDEAKQWNGFGTALKPAHEPICMARKPLEKGLTVAQNVLKWGTGAINIDGCRINYEVVDGGSLATNPQLRSHINAGNGGNIIAHEPDRRVVVPNQSGRFPANVIHDGSGEVLAGFPQQTSGANPTRRGTAKFKNAYGEFAGQEECEAARGAESGTAARFFYTAKASVTDREQGCDGLDDKTLAYSNQAQAETARGNDHKGKSGINTTKQRKNHHPTVKPTDLMQYLCRLVTPPGGLILDPFLGSGSTAKAALIERFKIIGIEIDHEYAAIAEARCRELQVKLF